MDASSCKKTPLCFGVKDGVNRRWSFLFSFLNWTNSFIIESMGFGVSCWAVPSLSECSSCLLNLSSVISSFNLIASTFQVPKSTERQAKSSASLSNGAHFTYNLVSKTRQARAVSLYPGLLYRGPKKHAQSNLRWHHDDFPTCPTAPLAVNVNTITWINYKYSSI